MDPQTGMAQQRCEDKVHIRCPSVAQKVEHACYVSEGYGSQKTLSYEEESVHPAASFRALGSSPCMQYATRVF
jgi:hypothetical protein